MRIETSLINARRQELCQESPKEKKQSSKKNKRRQKKPMQSVVQRLFVTCREVFSEGAAGIVPSPADIERLRLILDGLRPEDVGLNPDMPCFRMVENGGAPPVTYLHLYECDRFSICIFCLPPSGVIPLHNHPGMTVFSKILFGSMHIKSYDWADIPCDTSETLNHTHFQPSGIRLAKVTIDDTFTAPCNTSILYPATGGNMHCFTALTSCAVLDVLGPPYSDPDGRHCTYYRDFPYASFSGDADADADSVPEEGEGYAWLEERERPDDFIVVGANYRGPQIVEI